MKYTIVDKFGEIVAILEATGEDIASLNTPADGKFLEGVPPDHYSYLGQDGTWVPRPAPSENASWDPATKAWVDLRTVSDAKMQARQKMAAAWDTARASGVTIGAKTAPTDSDSWTRYLAIRQMAADGDWVDVPIPLSDGTFELLTQAKAAALWTALKTLERELLVRLRDRVNSINAAVNVADVDAVTW